MDRVEVNPFALLRMRDEPVGQYVNSKCLPIGQHHSEHLPLDLFRHRLSNRYAKTLPQYASRVLWMVTPQIALSRVGRVRYSPGSACGSTKRYMPLARPHWLRLSIHLK